MGENRDQLSRLQDHFLGKNKSVHGGTMVVPHRQRDPALLSRSTERESEIANSNRFNLIRARTTTQLSLPIFETDISPIYHRSEPKLLPSIVHSQNRESHLPRTASSVAKPLTFSVYPLIEREKTLKEEAHFKLESGGTKPIYNIKKVVRKKPPATKSLSNQQETLEHPSHPSSLPCVTLFSDSLNLSGSKLPEVTDSATGSSSHLAISLGNSLGADVCDLREGQRLLLSNFATKERTICDKKKVHLEAEILPQKIQLSNQMPKPIVGKKFGIPAKIPSSASRAYGSRAPARPRPTSASSHVQDLFGKEASIAKNAQRSLVHLTDPRAVLEYRQRQENQMQEGGQGASLRVSVRNMNISSIHLLEASQTSRQSTNSDRRPRSADSALNRKRPVTGSSTSLTGSYGITNQSNLLQSLSRSSYIDMNNKVTLPLAQPRPRPQSAQANNTKEYLLAGSYKHPFNKENTRPVLTKIEPIVKPIDRIREVIGFNPSGYIYEKGRIEKEKLEFLRQCNGAVRQQSVSTFSHPRKPRRLSWHNESGTKICYPATSMEPGVDENGQMDIIPFYTAGDVPTTPAKAQGPASARTAILETPDKPPTNSAVVQKYIASLENAQKPKFRPSSAGANIGVEVGIKKFSIGVDSLPAKVYLTREPLKRAEHKHQFSIFFDPTATAEPYDRTVRLRSRPGSASRVQSGMH